MLALVKPVARATSRAAMPARARSDRRTPARGDAGGARSDPLPWRRCGSRSFTLPSATPIWFRLRSKFSANKGAAVTDTYTPTPEHRFTFGLWTVGNPGRDPFGHEVRPPLDPVESVHRLAELGAYGVNFHDDDLVPPGSSAAEREAIVKRFRARARRHRHEGADGDDEPVLAPGLQGRRVHRQRPAVRRYAVRKTLDAIDLGAELGADGLRDVGRARGRRGRRGQGRPRRARPLRGGGRHLLRATSATAATTCASRSSRSRTSRAATSSCRPSATRSRSSSELEWPEMVGLNPEFAHETMSGLSFHHAVAQALWHGQALPHRPQRAADRQVRPGLPLRLRGHPRRLLPREAARGLASWTGMRHFDAHAYRTEDADGVWDFAARLHAHAT